MGNGRSFSRQLQPVASGGNQAATGGIRPCPVPLAVALTQFEGADGLGVAMEVSTPVGVAVYFLTPEGAKGLGEQLVAIGTAGASGLVVPA